MLEELLRRQVTPESMRVLNEVCDKICRRIGWTAPVPPADVLPFLREFYTAERAFLEHEQLYGKARADKYAQPATAQERMASRKWQIASGLSAIRYPLVSARSVEHRRNLLDIDAFLGHAQIVIRHDDRDRIIGALEGAPSSLARSANIVDQQDHRTQ